MLNVLSIVLSFHRARLIDKASPVLEFTVFDLPCWTLPRDFDLSLEGAIFLVFWVLVHHTPVQHVVVFQHVEIGRVGRLHVDVIPYVKFALLDSIDVASQAHQLVLRVLISTHDLVDVALESLICFVLLHIHSHRRESLNWYFWHAF